VVADQAHGREITVFTDYVCPYSYLSLEGLEAQVASGMIVHWRAFELRPQPTPALGSFADAEWEMVQAVAVEHGIELMRPAARPRTRKAHEASRLAQTLDLAAEMRRAIFEAYFRENRDIGRIDVLVDIGAGIGIEPAAMKVALDVDVHTADVAADQELAYRLGIEGTPAFIAGADMRLGYLSADHLREWLEG
jgi:predicted DsbA family dithiol-disulfide isomerase